MAFQAKQAYFVVRDERSTWLPPWSIAFDEQMSVELLEQYRDAIKKHHVWKHWAWGGKKNAMRIIVDLVAVRSIIQIAKETEGYGFGKVLESLIGEELGFGGSGHHSATLIYPATAWSMYWTECILCKQTIARHYKKGICRNCESSTMELFEISNNMRRAISRKQQEGTG